MEPQSGKLTRILIILNLAAVAVDSCFLVAGVLFLALSYPMVAYSIDVWSNFPRS
jgi:hypothetical protein